MPRLITVETDEAITPEQMIDALEDPCFDPADEDSLAATAPLLKRLANNCSFLANAAIAELKDRCHGQQRRSGYSAQVFLLHRPASRYLLRANFWPALSDPVVRSSGTAPFFYGLPHDHNFHFLTVGYLGPGYGSDYYDYDDGAVAGVAGEAAGLRFVERSTLDRGTLLLYRAHRDVHSQLPPEALSVSLNIMEASPYAPFLDQYRFDTERNAVAGVIGTNASELLLQLSVHFGQEEGVALARKYRRGHPSERMRASAFDALLSAAAPEGRGEEVAHGLESDSPLVRAHAQRAAEALGRP